jgi:hypothetical protein
MPGVFGVTVVTMLVCFFNFACEAAGASSARHSLRPLMFGAEDSCITRAQGAAGRRRRVCCLKIESEPAPAMLKELVMAGRGDEAFASRR